MKGNSYNKFLGFTAFGESHGPAIGLVIEDIKPGLKFPLERIQEALDARKPGSEKFTTSRQEKDEIQILSGVLNGITTGMPICLVVYNNDAKYILESFNKTTINDKTTFDLTFNTSEYYSLSCLKCFKNSMAT